MSPAFLVYPDGRQGVPRASGDEPYGDAYARKN